MSLSAILITPIAQTCRIHLLLSTHALSALLTEFLIMSRQAQCEINFQSFIIQSAIRLDLCGA